MKLSVSLQSKEAWDMERRKKPYWIGRHYVPQKQALTEDERIVQDALKARGILGGCWNLIIRGRLPQDDASEQGFRTLEA